MIRLTLGYVGGWLLLGFVAEVAAQGGIYTCIDAKGRRLTSDRPIPECLDREQKELNSTGSVRRTHGPQLTASERAAAEEKERQIAAEKQRQAEERRREKAMLARYPNPAAHDRERASAVNAVENVIAEAGKQVAILTGQRKKLDDELEFYKADPSKTPAKLKRQIEEADQQMAAQKRFIANQEEEKRRIHARFDEELSKLKQMWAGGAAHNATMAAAAASAPASGRR